MITPQINRANQVSFLDGKNNYASPPIETGTHLLTSSIKKTEYEKGRDFAAPFLSKLKFHFQLFNLFFVELGHFHYEFA